MHFMVNQGWKSQADATPPLNGRTRTVTAPVEHLGVRNALRGAFGCGDGLPADFDKLLAKIR